METKSVVLFLSLGFGAGVLVASLFIILRKRSGNVIDHKGSKQVPQLHGLEIKVSEPENQVIPGSPMVSEPEIIIEEGSGPFIPALPRISRIGEFKHISFTPDDFIDQKRSQQVFELHDLEAKVSEPENQVIPVSPMVSEPEIIIEEGFGPIIPAMPRLSRIEDLKRISFAPGAFSPLWKSVELPENVEKVSAIIQASPYPFDGTSSELPKQNLETDQIQNTSINCCVTGLSIATAGKQITHDFPPIQTSNDLDARRANSLSQNRTSSTNELYQIETSTNLVTGRVNSQRLTRSASVNTHKHKRKASEVYFSAIKKFQQPQLSEEGISIQPGLGRRNTSSTNVISTIEPVKEVYEIPYLVRL